MKKIIELDPKHLMANVNLSMYHMKVGDKATAEEYQARATAISIEKRIAEARAKGGPGAVDADLERIQKTEARLGKFRQIIEMDPGDVLGHFGAGKACLDLKRFGEAASHFEKTIAIQRDYSVAWANLGQAYAALGERDKARETFLQGIEVARGKGDMMPMRDMQTRLEKLESSTESVA
jgi:tetratricopeptide (TPR) repeat protein